jgi:pantoate--beta-alanine ligase
MTPERIAGIPEVRRRVLEARRSGATVGFVPTMGALHAGHAELIRRARQECACVVASVFVNPSQFDRRDDFEKYPRTLAEDLELCGRWGAGIVFAPDAGQMYPGPQLAWVEVSSLGEHLCGKFRPGHFRGVATVVAKLFNIIQPDRAYFGQKDAQQLAIIRKMVADLNFPVTVISVPTVREPDGLAISSRNRRLTPEDRKAAPALYRALQEAAACAGRGCEAPDEVKRAALAILDREPRIRVEYLEVVDPETMQPLARIAGDALVAAAIWLGDVRLIDNVLCRPGSSAGG